MRNQEAFRKTRSELACPQAVERLLLIVALATLHFLSIGLRVVETKLRRWVDPHWDRGLSYWHPSGGAGFDSNIGVTGLLFPPFGSILLQTGSQ